MMNITPDIFWLKVPFADIFTSVFLVRTPGGTVLFDTAAEDSDVDSFIVPVFEQAGLRPDYVFVSHNHGDHSGGLKRVMELYPKAVLVAKNTELCRAFGSRVLCPEEPFLQVLRPVFIPGHTADSMGLLDARTGTLLSGDCLQAYGVYGSGPWGTAIRQVGPYLEALDNLREMDIQTIVTAHDYHPFEAIVEKNRIPAFLDSCREALEKLRDIVQAHPGLKDAELVTLCNTRGLPRIDHGVINGVRIAMETEVL